jgi:Calx-beta domain-containing protein
MATLRVALVTLRAMHGRNQHVIPLLSGVLVAVIALGMGSPAPAAADDPPDLTVDDFESDSDRVQLSCPSADPPVPVSVSSPAILGDELDIAIVPNPDGSSCTGASGSIEAEVPGGATFQIQRFGVVDAAVTTTWDGPDNSGSLDPEGLGGVDLTVGGRKDSLQFRFPGLAVGVTAAQLTVTVYTDADHSSKFGPSPLVTSSERLLAPFGLWTASGALGGADFADVGAIVVSITDTEDIDGFYLDWVRSVSAVTPRMTDTLVDDADHDGQPTPDDTIEYAVTLARPRSLAVQDPVFELTPTSGVATFEPGSVTTTSGDVTTGNHPLDAAIRVDLDDLAGVPGDVATATETITFRVLIDAGGTLANQGTLTYAIGSGAGATTTRTDTDDPDTPAVVSDDTITLAVATPPTISITDAGDVAEGSAAAFDVSLSWPYTDTVTVDAATVAGTATAGSDFIAANQTLTFAPGETSKTVTVDVIDDTDVEDAETFTVDLANPTNGTIGEATGEPTVLAIGQTIGLATIVDNDQLPATTVAPSTTAAPVPTSMPPLPSTAAPAPPNPGTLPATGSDTSGLAMSSLLVLGVGSALTFAVRRRHS